MTDVLLSFLSRDYSGLLIALGLLAIAWLGYRRRGARPRRWFCGALGLLAIVLAIGAASHLARVRAIDAANPAPGKIVDVGGFDMHVLAEGPTGGPAVVWFPGGHSGGLGFYDQHRAVRDQVRSILVDRPGTGWSDTGPFPRTTAREADEVVRALEAAGETGPFIWAGHSFGGLLAANIARRYPDQTAAVVLLDPTPLDVLFYGADKRGLGSFHRTQFWTGIRQIFGLYHFTRPAWIGEPPPADALPADAPEYAKDPLLTMLALETHAGSSFAGGSILKELSAHGLVDRAWDTVVFDGELGDLPLYLVTPGEDPSTQPYAEQVLGQGREAQRFVDFLKATRERFLAASSRATRIKSPAGTTHIFPTEVPEFVTRTVLQIVADVRTAAAIDDALYEKLTTAWPGPYGGLPPVDLATPEALEGACRRAVRDKRAEVRAIVENPAAPTFDNTVRALEASGLALQRIQPLLRIFATTKSDEAYAAVAARVAPLAAALDDEIVHDAALFARVAAVHAGLPHTAPTPQARRLVDVTYQNFVRRGAALAAVEKQRLSEINARLAELRTSFQQNATAAEASLVVFIEDESGLDGLTDAQRSAARTAAEARGRADGWAVPIARPTVWPFLTNATSRPLREEVWRKWVTRGANPGDNDNRPVMTEILKLRGEKARLLGYPTFADYQTSARMIGTPDAALELLVDTWNQLVPPTLDEIGELQALADSEGADFELQAWDRLFYAEKLRREKFDLDTETVSQYLELGNVVAAMFWAAGEAFGFSFRRLDDVAVISDDIDVFEVSRRGELLGVLWVDLFQREGKGPASWAAEYRTAEDFRGKVLPLAALHSAVPRPADDGPVLVPWERANVIFHEFGHALHMLANGAEYPSLGMPYVPWDYIEAPSLLNERWLLDRRVLKRFARHHATGAPMPDDLIDRLLASLQRDRVFSTTLNFLGTAIVDMRLHRMADGREIDAMAEEQRILEELQPPRAIDLTLYVPHAFHTFSQEYAAGVYTYLWSDVIAADIAEAFLAAPGGLYDADVAERYYSLLVAAANTVSMADAFREFRGRDPDQTALLRRFGLQSGQVAQR